MGRFSAELGPGFLFHEHEAIPFGLQGLEMVQGSLQEFLIPISHSLFLAVI